jgi:hypothetical protein
MSVGNNGKAKEYTILGQGHEPQGKRKHVASNLVILKSNA